MFTETKSSYYWALNGSRYGVLWQNGGCWSLVGRPGTSTASAVSLALGVHLPHRYSIFYI